MEAESQCSADTIARYSRQLLVPAFGGSSQTVLSALRVLIVGGGGLGCPSALYLAGAGVKKIGIVDDDDVDDGNLHRQIAHTDARRGINKAASLAIAITCLNSGVATEAHRTRLGPGNAAAIIGDYDIVLDCTDNPGTRYLINDVCILLGKPLVSGAAIGCDGQLSVYGWRGGPCYRCLHPTPPPPSLVTNCSDAGVLGPVTGVIGSLQALEVMKIAASMARERAAAGAVGTAGRGQTAEGGGSGTKHQTSGDSTGTPSPAAPPHRPSLGEPLSGTLLVFDGSDGRMRNVRLRPRLPDCLVCGDQPSIKSARDSADWCTRHGLPMSDKDTPSESAQPAEGDGAGTRPQSNRLACECEAPAEPGDGPGTSQTIATIDVPTETVEELAGVVKSSVGHPSAEPDNTGPGTQSSADSGSSHGPPLSTKRILLLDVREPVQYAMARLQPSVNIPLSVLQREAQASGGLSAGASFGAGGPGPAGSSGAQPSSTALKHLIFTAFGLHEGQNDGNASAAAAGTDVAATPPPTIHVVCRRGVDSVVATRLLRSAGLPAVHVQGGLRAWSERVDSKLPWY